MISDAKWWPGVLSGLVICSLVHDARAGEFWVDGDVGNDGNPGSRSEPLKTIDAGLGRVKPGDTLHVLPRKTGAWPTDIRVTVSGLPDKPIVIDGHGSLASGRGELDLQEWKDEGDGVYSRLLRNNAWGMQRHWEGGFPLVWFDGEAGENVTSREALASGCFFLYKNQPEHQTDPLHNTLFIRPPKGVERVETIVGEGGIFVGGNHVTVRGFAVEYGGRDGFATHRNQGVVFEDIEARFFMDQGMSHHGAEVVVRRAHFHHNAGGRHRGCVPRSASSL